VISLEMAKKLKEAGLEWEPQRGDWYYFGDDGELHLLRVAIPKPVPEVFYSAPRLDRMLADIEKLGYTWLMQKENICGKYCFQFAQLMPISPDGMIFGATLPPMPPPLLCSGYWKGGLSVNDPIFCHNCGFRMIQVTYRYDSKTRRRAWFCAHCGRLVRFVKLTNGKHLPAPIWQGKRVRRRTVGV